LSKSRNPTGRDGERGKSKGNSFYGNKDYLQEIEIRAREQYETMEDFTLDSKSSGGNTISVQFRATAPQYNPHKYMLPEVFFF
jgi:hypothetical protein